MPSVVFPQRRPQSTTFQRLAERLTDSWAECGRRRRIVDFVGVAVDNFDYYLAALRYALIDLATRPLDKPAGHLQRNNQRRHVVLIHRQFAEFVLEQISVVFLGLSSGLREDRVRQTPVVERAAIDAGLFTTHA